MYLRARRFTRELGERDENSPETHWRNIFKSTDENAYTQRYAQLDKYDTTRRLILGERR